MPNFDFLKAPEADSDDQTIRINTGTVRGSGKPHRSAPSFADRLNDTGKGLIGCGCLVFVLGFLFLAVLAGTQPRKPWQQDDHSVEALLTAQALVKGKLLAPASAKFPGAAWDGAIRHVTRNGQTYRIDSFVDSQNVFGAMLRTRYSVTLTRTGPDIEDFTLDNIDVFSD